MLDSDVNLDVKMGTVCINYEMAAPGEFVEQFPFNTVHMSWKCFGFTLTFKSVALVLKKFALLLVSCACAYMSAVFYASHY